MRTLPKTVSTEHGPSVEGAGPELLTELLAEFERELRVVGAPTSLFNPGLNPGDVERQFESRVRAVPPELLTWFEWHNGEHPSSPDTAPQVFWSGHTFWDIAGVVRLQDLDIDEIAGNELDWDPNWLRLTGRWDNGIAIQCSDAEALPLVRKVAFDTRTNPADTDTQLVSLCTPIAWWIDAVRSGHYRWSDAGWTRYFELIPRERSFTGWV
ncbi:hypothetical protein [Salinibacterium sp. SWN167]|uniref:hypothetical protein n=1 Tax=Salinibacterium sp. SWN167 TaxID=2792054 RepID=UPI0018CFECAA|nr:hypothetical protein [Salinibacterium sp. SWN167]MBH0083146.1 hypothetical protein [Salinibacterium sp. SWN167]